MDFAITGKSLHTLLAYATVIVALYNLYGLVRHPWRRIPRFNWSFAVHVSILLLFSLGALTNAVIFLRGYHPPLIYQQDIFFFATDLCLLGGQVVLAYSRITQLDAYLFSLHRYYTPAGLRQALFIDDLQTLNPHAAKAIIKATEMAVMEEIAHRPRTGMSDAELFDRLG